MAESKGTVQLTLTPEQQEQVRIATGKLTDTLELSIEELEQRITPIKIRA
jgi:hypothetical protein